MANNTLVYTNNVLCGNCLSFLHKMPGNSIDALVTDPPYGLSSQSQRDVTECLRAWLNGESFFPKNKRGFMGKQWDAWVPGPEIWKECLRVLKPGAHALVFAGARTLDLMGIALRLAGFEIRDTLMWVYGSGFPKSFNLNKGVAAYIQKHPKIYPENLKVENELGTALKPAYEPIFLVRKPLQGTLVQNFITYGTGALNIGTCRVENKSHETVQGRWPSHFLHDGSPEVRDFFPESKGQQGDLKKYSTQKRKNSNGIYGTWGPANDFLKRHDTETSASRFFYCAKITKKDRGEGNTHPTVKPNALMRYLCRLITPPQGIVLDPFCGSGSTLLAAYDEGFSYIGMELNPKYVEIAKKRLGCRLQECPKNKERRNKQ